MNSIYPETLAGKPVTISEKHGFTFHGILQTPDGTNAVVTTQDGSILMFNLDLVKFVNPETPGVWCTRNYLGKVVPNGVRPEIDQIRHQINEKEREITSDGLREIGVEPEDDTIIESQQGSSLNESTRIYSYQGRPFLEMKWSQNTSPTLQSDHTFRFSIFYRFIK